MRPADPQGLRLLEAEDDPRLVDHVRRALAWVSVDWPHVRGRTPSLWRLRFPKTFLRRTWTALRVGVCAP